MISKEELFKLAEQLAYAIATSDALPGLSADLDMPVETDGRSVSLQASTESGAFIRITLDPDPM